MSVEYIHTVYIRGISSGGGGNFVRGDDVLDSGNWFFELHSCFLSAVSYTVDAEERIEKEGL